MAWGAARPQVSRAVDTAVAFRRSKRAATKAGCMAGSPPDAVTPPPEAW